MNYKQIAEVAMLAGTLMIESNAETYRVEETVRHILKVSNLRYTEAFVLSTGIMLTLDDPTIDTISLTKRVNHRSTNLSKIHYVNSVSRRLTSGQMTIEEAHQELKEIKHQEYDLKITNMANVLLATFFTIMLGGTLYDGLASMTNGLLLITVWYIGSRIRMNFFFTNVIACFGMTVLTVFNVSLLPSLLSFSSIMIGSVMPVVPGTIITNAIRDTFYGDYTSGMARTIEAFFIALSISIGVAIGLLVTNGGHLIA